MAMGGGEEQGRGERGAPGAAGATAPGRRRGQGGYPLVLEAGDRGGDQDHEVS